MCPSCQPPPTMEAPRAPRRQTKRHTILDRMGSPTHIQHPRSHPIVSKRSCLYLSASPPKPHLSPPVYKYLHPRYNFSLLSPTPRPTRRWPPSSASGTPPSSGHRLLTRGTTCASAGRDPTSAAKINSHWTAWPQVAISYTTCRKFTTPTFASHSYVCTDYTLTQHHVHLSYRLPQPARWSGRHRKRLLVPSARRPGSACGDQMDGDYQGGGEERGKETGRGDEGPD